MLLSISWRKSPQRFAWTGTDAEVAESVRYALRCGMPGGGYVLSTSNCVYTGMDLGRYELMLEIWRAEGSYPP